MPAPRRYAVLLALIVAGEAAFLLPFVLPRILRPTLLDVYNLTNLQLGTAFAVYGVVAMAAYFLGGPLADRFSPRRMLSIALSATAAGGVVLLGNPSPGALLVLYAGWGVSTIMLFWSPLIRATREWGGEHTQGTAFGLLDGGRGLLAALTATAMVALLAWLLPGGAEVASATERASALQRVVWLLMGITAGGALLVLWLLNDDAPADSAGRRTGLRDIARVLSLPGVWLQALIILCAYTGFKATDDFSLYANEVIGADEVTAAAFGTIALWARPLAAVSAGLLADRLGAANMTAVCFLILTAGSLYLASGALGFGMETAFVVTISSTALGIFALRGLYFAIMKEGRVPLAVTGSAVGFVSVLGYTPDVFMGPLMGWLLDRSPGAAGHQHVFAVVSAFAVCGLLLSLAFRRLTDKPR